MTPGKVRHGMISVATSILMFFVHQAKADYVCPEYVTTASGVSIRMGQLPMPLDRGPERSQQLISPSMAIAPITFPTVGDFVMKVPAVVVQPHVRCDIGGRVLYARFRFHWADQKLSNSALVSTNVRENYKTLVIVTGYFRSTKDPFRRRKEDIDSSWEIENGGRFIPAGRASEGVLAYRYKTRGRNDDTWDLFVLDALQDASQRMPTVHCSFKRSDWKQNSLKPTIGDCAAIWDFSSTFASTIKFHPTLLSEAPLLLKEVDKEISSYIARGK